MNPHHGSTEKELIIRTVTRWLNRSGLYFSRQVVARIHSYGVNMSEPSLTDRLTRRPERKPNVPPELVIATIHAFTTGLNDKERCRAAGALAFAKLSKLPFDYLDKLAGFFPMGEFYKELENFVTMPATQVEKVPTIRQRVEVPVIISSIQSQEITVNLVAINTNSPSAPIDKSSIIAL